MDERGNVFQSCKTCLQKRRVTIEEASEVVLDEENAIPDNEPEGVQQVDRDEFDDALDEGWDEIMDFDIPEEDALSARERHCVQVRINLEGKKGRRYGT
ncbi:hypothetical protein E1B28_013346 [Marasmius oreades]|uniref:Uncharacterized protein n=1 Tax=Marasmius oreades TaxID=181124 RepID=A0A9P7RPN8_9AGAR|nr:uncharacterized protein E1B28_013346 [Marasmius oreades]KAG7087372.1 hypothetical protein E1B28_013346 [Marasmius oreades]